MGAKKIKPVKPVSSKPSIVIEETYVEQLRIWAEKHMVMIVGISAAVLLMILSIWGVRAYANYKENSARDAYTAVASQIPGEKATTEEWDKLISDLQKFVSEHGGTQPGLLARIELSRAYFETKRYDEAVKAASEALKSAPSDHVLHPLVQYQLAYAYDAAGKPEEAAKVWEKLRELKTGGIEREADWNLGRIYAANKEYEKAAEAFQKAAQAPGSYPSPALIDQELARSKQQAGQK